ncbi:hypothetical protein ACGFZQ_42225 [Streptomyces sp. NPDC048254]|uniref:hypothetical protein n=1 Tax=Streptomyces sp. NPDC048254 TaxID=3365525 RepID=UPI003713C523
MLRRSQALGGAKGGRAPAHVFSLAPSPATTLLSSFTVFGSASLSAIDAFALTRRAAQRLQSSPSPMSLSVEAGS